MKNNHRIDFLTGLIFGLSAPLAGLYLFSLFYLKTGLNSGMEKMLQNHTFTQVLTLIVVISNFFLFWVFNKKNQWQKAKGVIGATLIFALFFVYWEIFK